MKVNVRINLPILLGFSDYHEIDSFGDNISRIIPKIKREELGSIGRKYWAIFYTARNKEYRKLIKDYEEKTSI